MTQWLISIVCFHLVLNETPFICIISSNFEKSKASCPRRIFLLCRRERFTENRTNINTQSLRQNASCASFFLPLFKTVHDNSEILWVSIVVLAFTGIWMRCKLDLRSLIYHRSISTCSVYIPQHADRKKKQNLFGYVEKLDKVLDNFR